MKKLGILLTLCAAVLWADIPPGYYDSAAGLSGDPLKSALHIIIDDHVEYSYNDLRDFILKDTDEDPNNSNNVILLYTGWSYPKSSFGGGASDWNREHTWAKSHGDFGTSAPAGTDAHHIRPTDVTVNSARGNLDFDNGGTIYIDGNGATQCRRDGDSWEPWDEVKGDVARMIFYMAVRYEGGGGEPDLELTDTIPSSPNYEPFHGKMSTLLDWHEQDPPSAWEELRNDKVYSYQENRNPFIDHPEYAAMIWGGVAAEPQISVTPLVAQAYPNPFNPETTIAFECIDAAATPQVIIYNARGQQIKAMTVTVNGTSGTAVWNGTDATNAPQPSGIYFYRVQAGAQQTNGKVVMIK
jgi:endonuclease I